MRLPPTTTKPPFGTGLAWGHPLARGLLARHLFNEGSGAQLNNLATDKHATLNSMDLAIDWVGSESGGAVDFDGVDDHGLSSVSVNGLGEGSIAVWFRATAGQNATLLSLPNTGPGQGFSLRLSTAAEQVSFLVNGSGSGLITVSATLTYSDSRRHLLLGTYDGVTSRLYFDGALVGTGSPSGTITAGLAELDIGRSFSGGTHFTGQVEDVRVYDRALTADEVAELYVMPYADTPFAPWSWYLDRAHAPLEVEAELNGAGNGWTNLTPDLVTDPPLTWDYGLTGTSVTDRVAPPGRLVFALDNSEANSAGLQGYYSPEHANRRAGFALGINVRARTYVNGILRTKFVGRLRRADPMPGKHNERRTLCLVTDWMDEAALYSPRIPTQVDKRSDQVLAALIAPVPRQPVHMSFDVGDSTFRYAIDNSQSEAQPLLTECQRVEMSEPGYLYIRGDAGEGGDLRHERRFARTAPVSMATFNDSMVGLTAPQDQELLRNKIEVTVHPRLVDAVATTVLYDEQGKPTMDPGVTEVVTVYYTDPSNTAERIGGIDFQTNADGTPIATTDYTFNTAEDGSGTDLTSQHTVTASYGANSTDFTITNNSGEVSYRTKLRVRGRGLRNYKPFTAVVSDAASIETHGERPADMDMPYQHGGVIARAVANEQLALRTNPGTYEATMRYVPTDAASEDAALALEPGMAITLVETVTGLSATYWIHHCSYRKDDTLLPQFEWLLQRALVIPTVLARAKSNVAVDGTSHAVSLPAGIVAGELLIVAFTADGNPTITWPSGWTEFASGNTPGNTSKLALAYRQADGMELSTITVTTSASEQSSHVAWLIAGAKNPASQAPQTSAAASGTSDSPDPDTVTPTGLRNYLWLAICGMDNGSATYATKLPAGYSNGQRSATATAAGTTTATGERAAFASSENPSAFKLNLSRDWVAYTIAVHPQ